MNLPCAYPALGYHTPCSTSSSLLSICSSANPGVKRLFNYECALPNYICEQPGEIDWYRPRNWLILPKWDHFIIRSLVLKVGLVRPAFHWMEPVDFNVFFKYCQIVKVALKIISCLLELVLELTKFYSRTLISRCWKVHLKSLNQWIEGNYVDMKHFITAYLNNEGL